ncbi:MAG: hypothetical protein K1X88_34325 [Nannocystaceae bacterium]|nr:hypothetical protein [Nannocystaceae bacterium]
MTPARSLRWAPRGWALAAALGCGTSAPTVTDDDDDDGGSSGCGMLVCEDRLRVSLVAAAGVFDGGAYTLAWTVDGVEDGCGFVLSGDAMACDGDPPCVLEGDCEAEFGLVAQPQFVLVDVTPAPHAFSLAVLRDDAVLTQTSFVPHYDTVYPNGPDCLGSCRVAAAAIDVP